MARIKIDGTLMVVDEVFNGGYLPMLRMTDGTEWYVAATGSCEKSGCRFGDVVREHTTCTDTDGACAGCAAETYWRDMASRDPAEFRCILGDENLIALALGQGASPGSRHVRNLDEWFALASEVPEELWASYDGTECDVTRCGRLTAELGFTPRVAYRHN